MLSSTSNTRTPAGSDGVTSARDASGLAADCGLCVGQRQPHHELAAAARPVTGGPNRAAVQFDQIANQGQADAHAAFGPLQRGMGLYKQIEHRLQHVLRNAFPRIAHTDLDRVSVRLHAQRDLAARRRVLGRIGQQVSQDLQQPRGVPRDVQGLLGKLDRQLMPTVGDQRPHLLHRVQDHGPQFANVLAKHDLALRHPGRCSSKSSSSRAIWPACRWMTPQA